MTVTINYKSSNNKKKPTNLVLFVDEKFNIMNLKKYISNNEFLYISDLLKKSDLKKKLLIFEINSKKKKNIEKKNKNKKINKKKKKEEKK